jgi:hypothetical protein
MHEKPLSAILNRDESRTVIAEHFQPQIDLLRDLANYGSNLVLRAYESSARGIADAVVCGVLLKQVIAMVDAVEVLIASGITLAAHPPARTAFEASLYVDFVLLEQTDHRGKCYLVGNYRDERLWCARVTKGTSEEKAFASATKPIALDIQGKHPELAAGAAAQIVEIDRILAQPDLAAVNAEFERLRGKRKHDVDWYVVAGATSIADIAKQVGRFHEYVAFYSKGSSVTHSSSYKDHLRFAGNEVRFVPVRHLAALNQLFTFVGALTMHTYWRVLAQYRPAEIPRLIKKYSADWRGPFLNAKQVNYSAF